ncbi:MAG TPA: serine protease [Stellaceae bacterium]|nr:serine protease [Stellaceae bacterium]
MPFLRLSLAASLIVGGIGLPRHAMADGTTGAGAPPASAFVVYCYDRARDAVTRDLASACRGEIVDESFAKSVEERRADAIARAVRAEAQTSHEGLHLARIGAAFYVDEQARLLTDEHVVRECKAVSIIETDRSERPASVLLVDPDADLALLAVKAEGHATARFRSDQAAAPDSYVAVVGYPDQGMPPIEPMITSGTLLRASDPALRGGSIIFHAAVRHGDSGGPIIDSRGLVIGVVRSKIDTVRVFRASGRDIEDIGMGADLDAVLDFLNRNHVNYQRSAGAGVLEAGKLLASAAAFVVRAECWN